MCLSIVAFCIRLHTAVLNFRVICCNNTNFGQYYWYSTVHSELPQSYLLFSQVCVLLQLLGDVLRRLEIAASIKYAYVLMVL
jgi:hypothetical protein